MDFKKSFTDHYAPLTDLDAFLAFSQKPLRKAIRVNTLKIEVSEIKKRLSPMWELTPVPWCKESFWIREKNDARKDIGNLREHVLGYIYVQEAASMLPPIVLDPQPGETILDMCAAPGSKTTQLAALMQNTGALFANESDSKRREILKLNLQRCGVQNVTVTGVSGEKVATWAKEQCLQFDRILVDAPCSATGTIRKSPAVAEEWNPHKIPQIAALQKKLLFAAFSMLKKGGTLVYSTCTMEPEENEGVVSSLLEQHPDADSAAIVLPIKRATPFVAWQGKTYDPRVKQCLRIWPQDNDTEGFFVAKIVKK